MSGQLFDVDRTIPQTCVVCGATRQPDEPTATQCGYEQVNLLERTQPRSRDCLNWNDPATRPLPI